MTWIRHLDDKFDFGKFRGCTFGEVMQYNPDYINWVVENVSGKLCLFADSVVEEVCRIFPSFEITSSFEERRIQKLDDLEECDDDSDIFDCHFMDDYEPPSYGCYSGSYAQDEMGYSDDDIDTIFDGDPDAYWNID